jgi:hypothetical protein
MRIDQRHPVEPGARRTTFRKPPKSSPIVGLRLQGARRTTFRKPRTTQLGQLCSEAVDGKARLLRCLATRLARWRSELTHHWESLPSDHFGDESGAAVFWVETISDAVLPAAGEKHGNVASVRLRLEIVARRRIAKLISEFSEHIDELRWGW